MSDTPRTDAVLAGLPSIEHMEIAVLARQLERELATKARRVTELALLANNRLQKLEALMPAAVRGHDKNQESAESGPSFPSSKMSK
jgi:hypothetical protein